MKRRPGGPRRPRIRRPGVPRPLRGDEAPRIVTPPPGPRSRAIDARLRARESPAIWGRDPSPVVWARARGCVVEDVDGNRYLDLTAGFGVATLGHAAPEVRDAVAAQAGRLAQGLGDLMPHEVRERLIAKLSALGGTLSSVLLAGTGSEAVELALKTARVATGRRRVVAFTGGYHGLTYGALAVTQRAEFRAPVADQVADLALWVPYPYPYRCPLGRDCGGCDLQCLDRAFAEIDAARTGPDPPGAILVEPVQGRAGGIVPPGRFLRALCAGARERGLLVIYDEVLTGAGRTGPFWAWRREGPGAEPDLLCAGKGLGGGVPLAAVLGRREVTAAWRGHVLPSGESPHASTFYGHPLACAGALAAVARLSGATLRRHVERMGRRLRDGLRRIEARHEGVGEVRSAGLLGAIEFVRDRTSREPDAGTLARVHAGLVGAGLLAVPGGVHGTVLLLHPPLVITEAQLDTALRMLDDGIARS
jgi:4-aminobutyrate aminotransferase/(S)-3-amino-2-methylpropionate transaminase